MILVNVVIVIFSIQVNLLMGLSWLSAGFPGILQLFWGFHATIFWKGTEGERMVIGVAGLASEQEM